MKGDLCGKILSRGIEQQNAVGLEKISVDRDAVPLIHPLSLILSPCPYAIGRRISSRTGYPSCGQVHIRQVHLRFLDAPTQPTSGRCTPATPLTAARHALVLSCDVTASITARLYYESVGRTRAGAGSLG